MMTTDPLYMAPPRAQLEMRDQLHLFAAVAGGHLADVRRLLNEGISPNSGDEEDDTLLTLAVGKGNKAMVQLLLEAGADVNLSGIGGKSPLRVALDAVAPDKEMVRLLLSAGADPLAKSFHNGYGDDLSDLMAADLAVLGKRDPAETDTLIYIVAEAAAVFHLTEIVRSGDARKLAQWLDNHKGEPVDTPNRHGATAMLHACALGRLDMAEMLWYAGADPSRAHKYDPAVTPLALATEGGHVHLARELTRYIACAEEELRRAAGVLGRDIQILKPMQVQKRPPKP